MKILTKHNVTLSSSEVKDAVREYIKLHSGGEIAVPDVFSVFMVLEGGARYEGVEIEAQIFE